MTSLLIVGVLAWGLAAPQAPAVTGRWTLAGPVGPGLASVVPAWLELTVEGTTVRLRRGTEPATTETYEPDEREVRRVPGQARACRAAWEAGALVLTCRQPGRGPGGQAPPIATREVLRLDADGSLIVERTWRSGTRDGAEQWRYRREAP